MAKWLRYNTNRRAHPKFKIVGAWGACAIEAAWDSCAEYDLDGVIADIFWNAEYLASRGGWDQIDQLDRKIIIDAFSGGMKKCEKVGLIKKIKTGWELHDWNDINPNAARERQRRYRERKRESVSLHNCDVTKRNALQNVTNDTIRNDTIRNDTKNKKPVPVFSANARLLARILFDQILDHKPDHKLSTLSPTAVIKKLNSFTHHIDLAIRVDKRNPDRLHELILWATHDTRFWSQNVQSGEKLRKHFDRLDGEESKNNPNQNMLTRPQTEKEIQNERDMGYTIPTDEELLENEKYVKDLF